MIAILIHNKQPLFGQDFYSLASVKDLDLLPVYLENNKFKIPSNLLSKITTIISRYPDSDLDYECIKCLPKKVNLICHLHLNYSYLNSNQKLTISYVLQRSASIIANSYHLMIQYKSIFPNLNITYVNNFLDFEKYYPVSQKKRDSFREINNVKNDKIIVCITGRLNYSKGIQLLYELINKLVKSKKYVFIIQTFDKFKQHQYIRKIKYNENVIIYFDQIEHYVKFSDIHLNFSLCETLSMVTIESLACGIPVINTNSTPFLQFINKNINTNNAVNLVELPKRISESNINKSNLILNKREITSIVDDYIDLLSSFERDNCDRYKLFSNLNNINSFNKNLYYSKLLYLYTN